MGRKGVIERVLRAARQPWFLKQRGKLEKGTRDLGLGTVLHLVTIQLT
jgi:hypothetical protein